MGEENKKWEYVSFLFDLERFCNYRIPNTTLLMKVIDSVSIAIVIFLGVLCLKKKNY